MIDGYVIKEETDETRYLSENLFTWDSEKRMYRYRFATALGNAGARIYPKVRAEEILKQIAKICAELNIDKQFYIEGINIKEIAKKERAINPEGNIYPFDFEYIEGDYDGTINSIIC